jgi:hypothetical protein
VIVAPADWTKHFGVHLQSLYPPNGGGRIRYYERITPLQPFSNVIRYVLDRDPDFRARGIVAPRELITSEGEYGAWTQINGSRQGSPAVRYLGAVFVDTFVAALDALAVLPERRAYIEHTAQDLLVNTRFERQLGARLFRYQPPRGWSSIPSGLIASSPTSSSSISSRSTGSRSTPLRPCDPNIPSHFQY